MELTLDQAKIWRIYVDGNHSCWHLYQHDTELWSIRDGFESYHVLTTAGEVRHEPGISNRNTAYFNAVFRFLSQEEALAMLRKCLEADHDNCY